MGIDATQSAFLTMEKAKDANRVVLNLAYQRLGDVREHLENGDFIRAESVMGALQQKISILSSLHSIADAFADVQVVQVQDVRAGFVVADLGTVESVEVVPDHGGRSTPHYHVHIEGSEQYLCLPRDAEIMFHADHTDVSLELDEE